MTENATTSAEAPTAEVPDYPMARAAGCPFDPPPALRALQSERPITKVRLWDGSTPWLVTRYADQRALLADPRVSADITHPRYPHPSAAVKARRREAQTFINMDDPEHARLRRMVTAPFAVKRMEALRPAVQKIVDDLIDDMLAGPKPVDLVEAFALPVPSLVICELLGVPYADHDFFQSNSRILINSNTTPEQAAAATQELTEYLDQLVAEKLANPGDDLLSQLAERVRAGELTRHEAADMGVLLLIAGHETTANMIALGTLALLEHPDQLAVLRESDDPKLVAGGGRGAAALPEHHPHRTAPGRPEDIEIGGVTIRAGEGVILANDIGNRDPRSSPTPTGWTSTATPAATWPSASASTSAWASRWPGWSSRSSTAPSTAASPPCGWPWIWTDRRSSTTVRLRRLRTARHLVAATNSTAREEDPMKVIIDQDKCVASGQCVLAAADVFDQRDEDGIVVLLNENPPADRADDVRQAVAVCPALAIWIGRGVKGVNADRRRRRLGRGTRRGRDAAPPRLRRKTHPGRRRAASAVRPATAVQAGSGRQVGTRARLAALGPGPDRAGRRPAARPGRHRTRRRPPTGAAGRRRARRLRRPDHRHRRHPPPPARRRPGRGARAAHPGRRPRAAGGTVCRTAGRCGGRRVPRHRGRRGRPHHGAGGHAGRAATGPAAPPVRRPDRRARRRAAPRPRHPPALRHTGHRLSVRVTG